jgi:hypothetical protein
MRQLTVKQKKVIDEVMRKDPEVSRWDELDIDTIILLEKINDTEILSQEVNRYMHDKIWSRL